MFLMKEKLKGENKPKFGTEKPLLLCKPFNCDDG